MCIFCIRYVVYKSWRGTVIDFMEYRQTILNKEKQQKITIQWNPREVNTLEVNSRLKSTPHGGPDFFLLCLSNFISLKVNDIGPILG